ncbi:MAG: tetratricopeptide repeat protein [Alistipes sp.]|nr:tetratricopeptide repeat protein [Alistipes senegalensis]MCM1250543.1 tetratricopeptide repeat protein [Alistipes sp.]
MQKAFLNPTPDQTFELIGGGAYDFVAVLAHSRALQASGEVREACEIRYQAFQRLAELLPDDEETIFEWNHPNSRAALEVLHASAIDHFLIDDFEMSAALLELLLELDPEDHLEASELLAFDYVATDETELFDEVIDDVPEKSAVRVLLLLWSAYRRTGRLPEEELMLFKSRFAPYFAEFMAAEHVADAAYLHDIESERPSVGAQARELWLRTENLWARWPEFIEALRTAK